MCYREHRELLEEVHQRVHGDVDVKVRVFVYEKMICSAVDVVVDGTLWRRQHHLRSLESQSLVSLEL